MNYILPVSIGESTDGCRRYVAKIVLKDMVTGKNCLAYTEFSDATTFSSIATCLMKMNGLQLLYPDGIHNGIQYAHALVLVTDGASYI